MDQPQLDRLAEATQRLVRTVDALDETSLGAASLLPGWTRRHVVAHVILNAEALARVMDGLARGEARAMYASAPARDADINDLSQAHQTELRDRFLASTTWFAEAARTVPPDGWTGVFERVPSGPVFPRAAIVGMRHREVEIHHADLGVDYTVTDWPEEFLDTVFNQIVADRGETTSMMLRTPDGAVLVGDGYGPVVTGTRARLTWWLLGRGSGEGLSADPELPTLGAWR